MLFSVLRDSEFFLSESLVRHTRSQLRDEHETFFLGNAFLDFNLSVQRERDLITSGQLQWKVACSSPRFQTAICLIFASNAVLAAFKAILY